MKSSLLAVVIVSILSCYYAPLATHSATLMGIPWVPQLVSNRSFTERECTMCRFSIGIINYALETQRGAEQVSKIANNFCALAHLETPIVCSEISKVFNHEIVKVLRNAVVTPNQLCGLISNNTCGHFHDPLGDWEVNLNICATLNQQELARLREVQDASQSKGVDGVPLAPYKIVHISDTHVDLKYQEGSWATCSEPLCCQNTSTPTNTSNVKSGHWGTYGSCDVPLRTFETVLKALNSSMGPESDIDYIVWTGDIQPHDVWKQDRRTAIATYESVFEKIFEHLPGVKIFPTFGNHEMVPVDSFSPSNLLSIAREDSPEWLYKKIDSYWSRWLPSDTIGTITKDGFYATTIRPGLKVVSLNTNFCHDKNFWLFIDSKDPGYQLQWLVHELQISELQHEKVHIIGHIPPGATDCFKVWSRNYNRILRRFSKTVSGQFFGHTHFNEFEMFYSQDGAEKELNQQPEPQTATTNQKTTSKATKKVQAPEVDIWQPISVGWIGPSLTTFIDLNPAYRTYTVDPNQDYTPIDVETFYMNLTAANLQGAGQQPIWHSAGSFTKLFGINDTSPASMHKLLVDIVREVHEEDMYLMSNAAPLYESLLPFNPHEAAHRPVDQDSKLYKLFRLYNSYSDVQGEPEFNRINKKEFLCSFFTGQSHNPQACNKFIYDTVSFNDIATNI